ncbi:hypothetical protein [Roseivirga echinicomitans]|nr:hypothetical protein [Roseivirga echinicomitans]
MYTPKWSFRLMLLFTLAISSCSSDDSTVPEKRLLPETYSELNYSRTLYFDSQYRLIRIYMVSKYSDESWGESTQVYFYDDEGILIESHVDNGWRMVYTYADDKIVRTDEYVYSRLNQFHTFEYNEQGRLSKSVTYQDIPEEGGVTPVSGESYDYDEKGNITEQRLYYYTSNGDEAKLLTVFTYSGYDDRINGDNMFTINPFNPLIKLSENNPGQMQIKNNKGEVSSTNTYTYQYHKKGHPVKKTTHVVLYNGEVGDYVSTYKFKD